MNYYDKMTKEEKEITANYALFWKRHMDDKYSKVKENNTKADYFISNVKTTKKKKSRRDPRNRGIVIDTENLFIKNSDRGIPIIEVYKTLKPYYKHAEYKVITAGVYTLAKHNKVIRVGEAVYKLNKDAYKNKEHQSFLFNNE